MFLAIYHVYVCLVLTLQPLFVKPPFRHYPVSLRVILLMALFFFNAGFMPTAAMMLVPALFGIQPTDIIDGTLGTDAEVNAFLFIQATGSLGMFAITALAFSQLEAGTTLKHLRLNVFPRARILLLSVAAIVVAQFFISFLVEVNSAIPLPDSLSFLKETEAKEKAIVDKILSFSSLLRLLPVTLVLAVIPAFSEELFFRGALLGILLRGKMNPMAAFLFSGFIFSLGHMQYNNILAIWVLGMFLGYLFYISGSLWLPIIVHFINNFLTVLFKYLYNNGAIDKDWAEADTPLWLTIASVVVFSGFLWLYNVWKEDVTFEQPVFVEDQPDSEPPNIKEPWT